MSTLSKLLDALGHELAFIARPPAAAAALATRARQWAGFAAWEAALERRPPEKERLAQAGELADFFLSRHKTHPTQPELRAHAEQIRAWRTLLPGVRPEAP